MVINNGKQLIFDKHFFDGIMIIRKILGLFYIFYNLHSP